MAIKYDKIEQGLYVAIGDGAPSGTTALDKPPRPSGKRK